jgi:CRISPR-associated protein Cmr2
VSNKIAWLAPYESGRQHAHDVARIIEDEWREMVRRPYGDLDPLPVTPGHPDVVWVCVSGDTDDFTDLSERAQAAMRRRRRARVFHPWSWQRVTLCPQSPSVPAGPVPRTSRRAERNETLSVAGWVKRFHARAQSEERFPATSVIASMSYRAALLDLAHEDGAFRERLAFPVVELVGVLDALGATRAHPDVKPGGSVPGRLRALSNRLGDAVSLSEWEPEAVRTAYGDQVDGRLVAQGRRCAKDILSIASERGIGPPTPHYAIVVQDLDHLGQKFSSLDLVGQRAASDVLVALGTAQLDVTPSHLGVPVYAGGDDYLAFAPAAHALDLARAVRGLVDDRLHGGVLDGATASTAVVFAHVGASLQDVVALAQQALKDAKNAQGRGGAERDALAVVVRQRGGERARTVLPWRMGQRWVTDVLDKLVPDARVGALSARLAARLEVDRASLDELAHEIETWDVLKLELTRLVRRQGGDVEVASALYELGLSERSVLGQDFQPVPAALVGRFLAQECR